MKTKSITFAIIAAVIAVLAVAFANLRPAVGVDSVIGYGTVLAIVALGAMEYRFDIRRFLGGR